MPESFECKKSLPLRPSRTAPAANDYSNYHIHSGSLPQKQVKNADNQLDGYPKLQELFRLKEQQISEHATAPYGCRITIDEMIPTLNSWIHRNHIVFDVVMIGCLTDNQFIYPLLTQLPIDRLISKPGFLFIWGSARKISELTKLLQNQNWAKKFRKSEELVFIPVDRNSPFYPGLDHDDESLFERMQWHCWMCITGTVRRSTDGHLIHCNIDTDLTIETKDTQKTAVPVHLYKVAENFSTATRRLHIIPARTGKEIPVKVRPGWVIMSPDILLNNFDCDRYKEEISRIGLNLTTAPDIEALRPKSPIQKKNQR